MGYQIKKASTARPLLFRMVLTSDHLSPATGLSPTVTISKNGATFASPAGAVTELANGWYKVAGHATDSGTVGPLLLFATAGTADDAVAEFEVIDNLEAADHANSLLDLVDAIYGGGTVRQALQALVAFVAGKTSGGGTATVIFRDVDDTVDAITLTVNPTTGNRSAVTIGV